MPPSAGELPLAWQHTAIAQRDRDGSPPGALKPNFVNELPEEIRTSANHESYFTVFLGSSLNEVERELIRRTIAFADGNKSRASELLGVPRRTLYGKLERYDARHKSNGRSNGNGYRTPRNDRLT